MKYPTSLAIYLDTGCNLRCTFCLYKGRADKPGAFDVRNLDKLETAIKRAKVICLSAWGEPLMWPYLFAVLEYIYARNKRDNLIAIVTNGTLLSPDVAYLLTGHLGELVVSLNAGTPATYERDMGGDWHKTLFAVRGFVCALDASDRNKIGLHMVAHTGNFREMAELVSVAYSLGITRVRVDQMMAVSEDQIPLTLVNVKDEYEVESDRAHATARKLGVKLYTPHFGYGHRKPCTSPIDECHVWADGRVTPCCYNGSNFLGNAYETDFESVWFGDKAKQVRKRGMPQCESCPKVLPFDDPRAHVYPLLQERLCFGIP